MKFQDRIAQVAINHYELILPQNKGKPKENEWTVYAAIVATKTTAKTTTATTTSTTLSNTIIRASIDNDNDCKSESNSNNNRQQYKECSIHADINVLNDDDCTTDSSNCSYWVVSCATGTKCTNIHHNSTKQSMDEDNCKCDINNNNNESISLSILSDSHAEVLARRGLVLVLWNEIQDYIKNTCLIQINDKIKAQSTTTTETTTSPPHEYSKVQNVIDYNDNSNHQRILECIMVPNTTSNSAINFASINVKNEETDNNCETTLLEQTNSIEAKLLSYDNQWLLRQQKHQFRLRPDIQLHLYISDSPCGDASIYTLHEEAVQQYITDNEVLQSNSFESQLKKVQKQQHNQQNIQNEPTEMTTSTIANHTTSSSSSSNIKFTGAKVIVSDQTNVSIDACGGQQQILYNNSVDSHATYHHEQQTIPTRRRSSGNDNNQKAKECTNDDNNENSNSNTTVRLLLARENEQIIGKLRTKSGRSNIDTIHRSTSMSCSDKIVRWSIVGLQGSMLLSTYIPEPIRLSSVVVSSDPRSTHSINNYNNDNINSVISDNNIPRPLILPQDVVTTDVPVGQSATGSSTHRILDNSSINNQPISDCNGTGTSNTTCSSITQMQALDRAISKRIVNVVNDLSSWYKEKITHSDTTNQCSSVTSTCSAYDNYIQNVQFPKCYIINHIVFTRGKSWTEYLSTIAPTTATTTVGTTTVGTTTNQNPLIKLPSTATATIQTTNINDNLINVDDDTTSCSYNKSDDPIVVSRKRKEMVGSNGVVVCTKRFSPAGISFNWQQNNNTKSLSTPTSTDIEITVGARGIRQGKKPKSFHDYTTLQSRLSRSNFIKIACACTCTCNSTIISINNNDSVDDRFTGTSSCTKKNMDDTTGTTTGVGARKDTVLALPVVQRNTSVITTYKEYKQYKNQYCDPIYKEIKERIFHHGPLAGWLVEDD